MEFDWLDVNFDLSKIAPKEIEESFEDPFAVRILPDSPYGDKETRYFCLGKAVTARGVFSVFWTDGKRYRVILARDMTADENAYYERKLAEIK
ncbi:MAG: uncharacterized DUF497 family protein [Verrucomicrobiales bacterium]|jgi:uncharacterized DUF497 family protein